MMYRWSVLPRSNSINRDAENEDQRMQRTETIHPRMFLKRNQAKKPIRHRENQREEAKEEKGNHGVPQDTHHRSERNRIGGRIAEKLQENIAGDENLGQDSHQRAPSKEIAERVSELDSALLKMKAAEWRYKKQQERQNKAKDDRTDEVCIVHQNVVDRFARIQDDENLLENMTKINSQFYGLAS